MFETSISPDYYLQVPTGITSVHVGTVYVFLCVLRLILVTDVFISGDYLRKKNPSPQAKAFSSASEV